MSSKTYQSNQLISILDSLFKQNSSGVLSLKTQAKILPQQRSGLLVLRKGALVYGGIQVPNAQEFCRWLGETLKPNLITAALAVAVDRAKNSNDPVELLEMLIRMKVFTWQEVETFINTKTLLIIEKFVSYPGEMVWQPENVFNLSYGEDRHGLNWNQIQTELKNRQTIWQGYAPQIPSMDAIPFVTSQQQGKIDNPQVKDHFRKSVDGKRTLIDIAEKMGKDPLKVAKNYVNWVNNGWVSFTTHTTADPNNGEVSDLPVVLSVDDSAIVQISIKRALQNDYKVLLANKVAQAIEILNEGGGGGGGGESS